MHFIKQTKRNSATVGEVCVCVCVCITFGEPQRNYVDSIEKRKPDLKHLNKIKRKEQATNSITMSVICNNQRPTKILEMPSTKSKHSHDKLSYSPETMKAPQSNCNHSPSHSCANNIPDQSVFITNSTSDISTISIVRRQFSTTLFNRKWIFRYLLTFFILMYAINCTPILLSNAQTLKSNRSSAATVQNSGTATSTIVQRTTRNSRNNHIRKEHFNSNPSAEISERPSCHSCSLRKDAEAENLKSFKDHILRRLRLEHAPNVSMESVTSVSESLLTNFYNQNGDRYIRRYGRNQDYMDEMMSDEPQNHEADGNRVGEDDDSEDEDEQFFSSTQSVYSFPNGKLNTKLFDKDFPSSIHLWNPLHIHYFFNLIKLR